MTSIDYERGRIDALDWATQQVRETGPSAGHLWSPVGMHSVGGRAYVVQSCSCGKARLVEAKKGPAA